MGKEEEMYDFILASGSPRRKELLERTGWRVMLRPVILEENLFAGESPQAYAERLALEKAENAISEDNMFVLGADTIVISGNRILGKPENEEDALDILRELQGKMHKVLTAIALVDPFIERTSVETCETYVPMRAYNEQEMEDYIASGSPLDKAGAYGIQDEKFHPVDVDSLVGCYANVMGLPLCHLTNMMREFGGKTPPAVPERCIAYTNYNCHVYKEILQRVT